MINPKYIFRIDESIILLARRQRSELYRHSDDDKKVKDSKDDRR